MTLVKRRHLAIVALLGGASVVALGWLVGTIAVASPRLLRRRGQPDANDLRLESLDGRSLAATYLPGAREDAPGVLIVHGLHASRRGFRSNADWLASNGYAVLSIDLRGHGGSDAAPCGFGWSEAQDVHCRARVAAATSVGGACGDHRYFHGWGRRR